MPLAGKGRVCSQTRMDERASTCIHVVTRVLDDYCAPAMCQTLSWVWGLAVEQEAPCPCPFGVSR